jgi:NAD(P)-dependent dehydrogenase (short-subunit alcohol dehydrogenase family)
MRLQGKRALITGGSSGIGFAIAEAMLGRGTIAAVDVGTERGRQTTLELTLDKLGGLARLGE